MAKINGTKGNDANLLGTEGNDVIKALAGDDTITPGAGNDTITGGAGHTVINVDLKTCKEEGLTFGDDIVNLTKGEKLTLNIIAEEDPTNQNAVNPGNYAIKTNGKDYTIAFYKNSNLIQDANGNYVENTDDIIGSITFKNFAAKDVLGAEGSLIIKVNDFEMDLVKEIYTIGQNSLESTMVNYDTIFNNGWVKTGVIKGTRISEDINASEYEGIGKKAGKGVTINAGAGNDNITGSKYDDKITGGDGNDILKGGAGNDVITGGKGKNTIIHFAGAGNDTINLTKGEQLTLKVDSFDYAELSDNKKDVLVHTTTGEVITIKNLGSKDVTNDATKKKEDESSVMLQSGTNAAFELRDYVYKTTVDKNYTGTWLNENIDASGIETAFDKKGIKGVSVKSGNGDDEVTGSKFNDSLYGGNGYDYINGGDGNDLIKGEKGESWLVGGAGNDTIEGGSDYDYIQGGADADLIKANNGDDYIEGNEGADTIYGGDGSDTIVASTYFTSKPDGVNTVTDYYSHFLADKNAKTIDGGKGNDVIWGSAGADTIKGGDGNDKVYAFGEGSVIDLGNGDDRTNLYQNTAKTLFAGAGNDTVSIEYGKATVDGGAGNDTIWGGFITESDLIFKKGSGHDLYQYRGALKTNTAGDTTVNADTLVFENISTSALSFNQDGDNLVISYGKNDSVTVKDYYKYLGTDDLTYENNNGSYLVESGKWEIYVQTKDGGKELLSDVLASYENGYIGTSKADDITGTNNSDLIYGYAGNDFIFANKGADTIYGGAGNDEIIAFGENSVVYGGDGKDDITLMSRNQKVAYGEKGNDYLSLEYGLATISGGVGNDTIEGGFIDDSDIVFAKGDGKDLYQYRGAMYICDKESGKKLNGDYEVNAETLVFEDSSISDLSFVQKGDNLVITYGKNSSVTVENYYKFLGATEPEQLEFVYRNGNIAHYVTGSENWEIYIQTKDGNKSLLSDVLSAYKNDHIGTSKSDTFNVSGDWYLKNNLPEAVPTSTLYGGEGADTFNVGKGTFDVNLIGGEGADLFNISDTWHYDAYTYDGNGTLGVCKGSDITINDFSAEDTIALRNGTINHFLADGHKVSETDYAKYSMFFDVTVDAEGKGTADLSKVMFALDDKDSVVSSYNATTGKLDTSIVIKTADKNGSVLDGKIVFRDTEGNDVAYKFNETFINDVTEKVAAWLTSDGRDYASVADAITAGDTEVLTAFVNASLPNATGPAGGYDIFVPVV